MNHNAYFILLLTGTCLFLLVFASSCRNEQQEALLHHERALESIDLFMDQENTWSDALLTRNKQKARQAMDSMDAILLHYDTNKNDFIPRSGDSLYFFALWGFMDSLNIVLHAQYQEATHLALLPDPEFTYLEYDSLMKNLNEIDLWINNKLENLSELKVEAGFFQKSN